MDPPACHVIYVSNSVAEDRILRPSPADRSRTGDDDSPQPPMRDHVRDELRPLTDAFGDVHVCATGSSCLSKLVELYDETIMNSRPTIVLLDTPQDEPLPEPQPSPRPTSPFSDSHAGLSDIHSPDESISGLSLMQKLITEAHLRGMSRLIVPIPVIRSPPPDDCHPPQEPSDGALEPLPPSLGSLAARRRLVWRCLDLGAVDVLVGPLSPSCISTLEICAYKAHRDASREQRALFGLRNGRKRSWVGVDEQKPFAYLREAMVSGLMKGICQFASEDDVIASAHITVSSERQAVIAEAIGHWHFSARSFTDDELLFAAMVMFKHALSMPELEPWRIPTDHLIAFLVACRASYNSFVPYHNFLHVIDVLQATFNFLTHLGALPPYRPQDKPAVPAEKSPFATLLRPFEALTLLVTAVGHDVGHPGVNNGFLATLNAPLAQLYNDRSVLESFHCAAYSQILRRYWPAVFDDRDMRSLMISSILSTDMGLHFEYMKKLGDAQEKLHHKNSIEGWNSRHLESQRSLACSLLIKCADISNVARHHKTALQWMYILSEEFSRQAFMEEELGIKSSLFAPPKKDAVSLSNAQLGFMNMFAIPLFQGVADIMPEMRYTVDELEVNKRLFERQLQEEKSRSEGGGRGQQAELFQDGALSPRSRSLTTDDIHGDGLSAPRKADEDASQAQTAESLERQSVAGADPAAHAGLGRTASAMHPQGPESASTKRLGGQLITFDVVRDFAESDTFKHHGRRDGSAGSKLISFRDQRCSETTDGSTSGAGAGDWTSQDTGAMTSKMPISPSTQGTSIVSGESIERPGSSAPGLSASPPSAKGSSTMLRKKESLPFGEESNTAGYASEAEIKSLKKKPSWFRIREFPFFRRNKRPSSPCSAVDTAS